MSNVYFTGCLHLGCESRGVKKRGFDTVDDHDYAIMDGLLRTVDKRDKLFILGDVTSEHVSLESLDLLRKIPCPVVLILGNHDVANDMHLFTDALKWKVWGCKQYKRGTFLSHVPIHPMEFNMEGEHKIKLNIHAHLHKGVVHYVDPSVWEPEPDPRYYNVGVDHHEYKPVSITQIRDER